MLSSETIFALPVTEASILPSVASSLLPVTEEQVVPSVALSVPTSSPRKPLIRDRFPPHPQTPTSSSLANRKEGKDTTGAY